LKALVGCALLASALCGCAPQVVDAVLVEAAAGAPNSCADPARDTDLDGTADCDDACPTNPDKFEPGRCGCELPEVNQPDLGIASCLRQVDTLAHRYAFDGTGSIAFDSRGGADGAIAGEGALLDGSGVVALAGRDIEGYVDLPNGILSSLESTTLEVWLTFFGGDSWERIFDFGDNSGGVEGERGRGGLSYLFMTPRLPDAARPFVRVAYKQAGEDEVQLDATRGVPTGALTHVAVTFDHATTQLSLYLDGELANEKVFQDIVLSEINDVNNWLGRSQYIADRSLSATIEEFRIYSVALTPSEIRTSFRAGPNPSFFAD
jgi:hypothetical protein